MSKIEPVWIDCDPGIDDALAIILACFSPNVKVIGLSTVAGNCSLDQATLNALNVLNIAGKIKKADASPNLAGKSGKLSLNDSMEFGGLSIPVVIFVQYLKSCGYSSTPNNKIKI